MKLIPLFLLILLSGRACDATDQDMETAIVDYTANTRGFYQHLTVANRELTVSKVRGDQSVEKFKISDQDWKKLVTEFGKIKLDQLPDLKAPTEKRFHDGAAIADLKIKYKEQEYQSSSFDHGTPPAEIAPLVNQIIALAKTHEH